jgi:hypothetical protein
LCNDSVEWLALAKWLNKLASEAQAYECKMLQKVEQWSFSGLVMLIPVGDFIEERLLIGPRF